MDTSFHSGYLQRKGRSMADHQFGEEIEPEVASHLAQSMAEAPGPETLHHAPAVGGRGTAMAGRQRQAPSPQGPRRRPRAAGPAGGRRQPSTGRAVRRCPTTTSPITAGPPRLGAGGRVDHDVGWRLIQAPAAPHRVPELPAAGPFPEGDLADEFCAHPVGVCGVSVRHVPERGGLPWQGVQLLPEFLEFTGAEAAAHPAHVPQLRAVRNPQQQRAHGFPAPALSRAASRPPPLPGSAQP